MLGDDRLIHLPGARFAMGSESGYAEESPVHMVTVGDFEMDVYPVTNGHYRQFCEENGRSHPADPAWPEKPDYFDNFPSHPVVNVSWQDAAEYAAWKGKRLPSEAEWEYAARGGVFSSEFPWGTDGRIDHHANFADRNTEVPWRDIRFDCGHEHTSAVGSYHPNGFGFYDMIGNVWEWCDDWFWEYADTVHDPAVLRDGWGGARVCRGGCFHSNTFDLRVTRRRRVLGGSPLPNVGFRCVRDSANHTGGSAKLRPAARVPTASRPASRPERPLPPPDGYELCMGCGLIDKATAADIRSLGFTSVQQYVTWESVEPAEKDAWDFHLWESQAAHLEKAGLKWVPFLIAGPAYSLPSWYRWESGYTPLRCLEHRIDSKVHSIWEQGFLVWVERFIEAFAARFAAGGILESLILGISGDFGESIFPDWHGEWATRIPGFYHSHAGFWCADELAVEDFRAFMLSRYGSLQAMNAAWGTAYPSLRAVAMPEIQVDPVEGFRIDEHTMAGSFAVRSEGDRARCVDFMDWYRGSMNLYTEQWLEIVRRYFPTLPLYVCTGGYAQVYHGSDFPNQCRIAARYGAGIRITNEASRYANNFFITNWVPSAAVHYGCTFGFEPAGIVNNRGVPARIFNAAASGASQIHFYHNNLFGLEGNIEIFAKNLPYLRKHEPVKKIAAFYPDVSIALGNTSHVSVAKNFELLRDYSDYRYVDDTTVADGILDDVRVLILCEGELYRQQTLKAIEEWVRSGGLLAGYNIRDLVVLHTNESRMDALFAREGGEKRIGNGASLYLPVFVKLTEEVEGGYFDTLNLTKVNAIMLQEDSRFYQERVFDPITAFLTKHELSIPDGQIDGLYAAETASSILLFNDTDGEREKTLLAKDGKARTIHILPYSLAEVSRND